MNALDIEICRSHFHLFLKIKTKLTHVMSHLVKALSEVKPLSSRGRSLLPDVLVTSTLRSPSFILFYL